MSEQSSATASQAATPGTTAVSEDSDSQAPESSRPSGLLGAQAVYPATYDDERGLTKRELFSAIAMQGLVAITQRPEIIAEWAVEQADALLKELAR